MLGLYSSIALFAINQQREEKKDQRECLKTEWVEGIHPIKHDSEKCNHQSPTHLLVCLRTLETTISFLDSIFQGVSTLTTLDDEAPPYTFINIIHHRHHVMKTWFVLKYTHTLIDNSFKNNLARSIIRRKKQFFDLKNNSIW